MLFFLLIFLLSFRTCVASAAAATGDFNEVLDNSPIVISLQHYNVSTPGGESIDSLYTLPADSLTRILLTKIPDDVHFVVLQVHSYLVKVTLSLYNIPLQNNSIQGTNVGLVKMNEKKDLDFYLRYNSSSEEAYVMISVQAYSAEAPIPGGCNMEFGVEISPYLLTTYNDFTTDVNFAPSAPPLSVLSQALTVQSNECNLKPSPVHHLMYQRYFPERDFSNETYFSVLKSMMTTGRILEHGRLVPEKLTGFPMKRIFATYRGTGNAFVVISHFENHTAVYVPSFSYGCSDLSEDNTCLVLTTTFSKVLCAAVLFLGLLNCFFGHFIFKMEVFLFWFLASGIVSHVIISLSFANAMALPAAASIGVLSAPFLLCFWSIFGKPIVSLVLATSVFGFLLASVIYYPIIDLVDLLVFDINFWGIFIGIMLSCPILMVCLAEKANIISCAFVGSYVGILSIDYYIGSNLRYIIINTIRRAVADKFNLAIIGPPVQWKDIVLACTWIVLAILGIAVQKLLMRFKPPYPPPDRRWKKPSSSACRSSERSPLLSSYPNLVTTSRNYTFYDGN